jgi:transcription elongation GreA/GreB family factor
MQESFKQQLYNFCLSFVDGRVSRIKNNIQDIRESLDAETKNSVGDKHETGRAMLQMELEKSGNQLAEAEAMKQLLDGVSVKHQASEVILGSMVHTSKANYFLAISAGEFKVEGTKVYCISQHTPIGQLLWGKSVGEVVVFNGEKITISEVY